MGRLLFLLPLLACAQTPTYTVHANVVDSSGTPVFRAELWLHPSESANSSVISITAAGFREAVHAFQKGQDPNLGTIVLDEFGTSDLVSPEKARLRRYIPTGVLTVCEALESTDRFYPSPMVIVGIFKSGLDETLRQDCPNQLVTGDIGWMSAIALTHPTDPPESLRAEIEKKRAIILASGPPGAHPRPERVVALYGRLVSPSGLSSIPCCTAPVEINAAPARLVGLDERDFRVLR